MELLPERFLHRASHLLRHMGSRLIPSSFYSRNYPEIINQIRKNLDSDSLDRVDYYNKLSEPFSLEEQVTWKSFTHRGHSSYKFDLFRILKHFPNNIPFNYYFGDRSSPPDIPTFIKARSLSHTSPNAVLMKFNSRRHYFFPNDPYSFREKSNTALWRGGRTNNPLRQELINRHTQTPKCDFALASRRPSAKDGILSRIPTHEQLKHKFLISIEGNDVATNLKWIMHSNSLCFMPKPTRESWFMEGTLVPGEHYVELDTNFLNLEEKIDYYSTHTDEAEEIINNAQEHCRPFLDHRNEEMIGILVAEKYFSLCSN